MDLKNQSTKEKKSYVYAVIAMLILMLFNQNVIFQRFPSVIESYFLITVGINVVVLSLLANATYYTSKTHINDLYVAIAFFSFIMITDYIFALGMIHFQFEEKLAWISCFIGMGKMVFTGGILVYRIGWKAKKIYNDALSMALLSVGIFVVQGIVIYLITHLNLNKENILFFIHTITVVFIVMIIYELLLEAKADDSNSMIFSFSVMLVAEVFVTLQESGFGVLIQSQLVLAVGISYFFYHVNQNNFVIPKRENDRLQRQFNLYAMNLKKIIDKKTLIVRDVNDKFIDELEYAKKIQQSLLPNTRVNFRDVNFVSEYFPCERLSGDFYDLYRLDDDNVALYLLDVSGHGISAALMTMFSNNYLKSNDQNLQLYRGLKPDRNLKYFYEQFNQMSFPDEMHMVIFYATLNLNTKVLTYCSGGLNCSPIRFKKSGKYEFLDKSEGFPICKLSDFYTPEFRSEKIQLESGDRIVFFTDGLVDKEKNKMFDENELIRFFQEHKTLNAREINDQIINKINPMRNLLNDDITYIIMDV